MASFFNSTVRITLITIGVLLVVSVGVIYLALNESLPETQGEGARAEQLADQIFEAVNKPAWDTTNYVQFSFNGLHHFLWNKRDNQVMVEWNENRVVMNLSDQTGRAYVSEIEQDGADKEDLLADAWFYFCNDAFWLNPAVKIRDEGTTRELVEDENGRGLLVTFNQGGVTPGDKYLFVTNAHGLIVGWKMWVSIIPVGGIQFIWGKWTKLSTGANVSLLKKGLIDIELTNVEVAQHISELSDTDPFAEL